MNRKIADPGQELCVCVLFCGGIAERAGWMVTHSSFQLERGNLLLGLYNLCSLASESGICQKRQVSHNLQVLSLVTEPVSLY